MTRKDRKQNIITEQSRKGSKGGEINNLMKQLISYLFVLLLIVVIVTSCSRTYDPVDNVDIALTNSCTNCHTDQAMLIANTTPDTTSSEGEAGEG